jgi:hypothetical protein
MQVLMMICTGSKVTVVFSGALGLIHYDLIIKGQPVIKEMYAEIFCHQGDAVIWGYLEKLASKAGFFCMTMGLHISSWWSKHTLPSIR